MAERISGNQDGFFNGAAQFVLNVFANTQLCLPKLNKWCATRRRLNPRPE